MIFPRNCAGGVIVHSTGTTDGKFRNTVLIGHIPSHTGTARAGTCIPDQSAAIVLHHTCSPAGIRYRHVDGCLDVTEGTGSNGRRASRECDLTQVITFLEGIIFDGRHRGRDSNLLQIPGARKCVISDFIHTGRNAEGTGLSAGIATQNSFVIVIEDTVHAAECRIAGGYIDGCQIRTVVECGITDLLDIFRNGNLGQAGTICKGETVTIRDIGISADFGNAVSNGDGAQIGTISECVITDGGNSITDDNRQDLTPQGIPFIIGGAGIIVHITGAGNGKGSVKADDPIHRVATAAAANGPGQGSAVILVDLGCRTAFIFRHEAVSCDPGKCGWRNFRNLAKKINFLESHAVCKGIISNGSNSCGNVQVVHADFRQCIRTNGLQATVQPQVLHSSTAAECAAAQRLYTGRNRHTL